MHSYFLHICLILLIFHNTTTKSTLKYNKGPISKLNSYISHVGRWFYQKLDHFDIDNAVKWKQRVFVNNKYYNGNPSGPIFLIIGGETDISSSMSERTWLDYAKEFKALIFQLEHRYYGKSHPTPNLNITNLRYLTSEQALGDLANFIRSTNSYYRLNDDVKWVLFGCSYAGSLAVWMKSKYPKLVYAVVASSAPLVARVDFKEYFKIVYEALDTYSPGCKTTIRKAIDEVTIHINNKTGHKYLNRVFNLCEPIDETMSPNDISNLIGKIVDCFAAAVQYNDLSKKVNSKNDSTSIENLCKILMNNDRSELIERLSRVVKLFVKEDDKKCMKYRYMNEIIRFRNDSWDGEKADGSRQWIYQTCNEFGFFQPHSLNPQFFGNHVSLNFCIQQCKDIFGPKYNEEFIYSTVVKTNKKYGELKISVDKVIFVYNLLDPWHLLGILNTTSEDSYILRIKGTSHCAEMYQEYSDEPPQLKTARKKIKQIIQSWLR